MLEEKAALQIQRFFASYLSKKQAIAQEAISTSPSSKLLCAFDLRFQCMRAVAAAKFPINKPIEDPAQVIRVIASIRDLAGKKGIANLDAIERLFHQSILLAERIQAPYYHTIWKKTYPAGIDSRRLIDHAYKQLCTVIRSFDLPIARGDAEKIDIESADVLGLARDIIQHASKAIVGMLAEPRPLLDEVARVEFAKDFEKMLAKYMTPKNRLRSKEDVQILAKEVQMCGSIRSRL